jgi:hypothetical protein
MVAMEIPTIAIAVIAGIATAAAILWCFHLFERWRLRRWTGHLKEAGPPGRSGRSPACRD